MELEYGDFTLRPDHDPDHDLNLQTHLRATRVHAGRLRAITPHENGKRQRWHAVRVIHKGCSPKVEGRERTKQRR
jgi:hypothetical protein